MTQRTPPFCGAEEWDTVPADLQTEIWDAAQQPLDVRPDESPCIWLDQGTRRCRHYDIRPEICREFEVGGESCLEYRRGARAAEASAVMGVVRWCIKHSSLRFGTEIDLQDDLETVLLRGLTVPVEREVRLSPQSVIDFRILRIGIECKVGGSPQEVLRQCRRYLEFDELDGLLLVTSRPQHRWNLAELGGKPFGVVWVAGQF